jgi:hypothetical protein
MVGANIVLGRNLRTPKSLELTEANIVDRAKIPLIGQTLYYSMTLVVSLLQHYAGLYLYTSVAFYTDSLVLTTTLI